MMLTGSHSPGRLTFSSDATNCFLIAATCVGERVGASVMLSTRRTDDKLQRSSGAVFDVGADRPWR